MHPVRPDDIQRMLQSYDDRIKSLEQLASSASWLPGDMRMSARNVIDPGWLLCNGANILRADFPALFAAIGTAWGTPSSSLYFRLPDVRGRVPIGAGSGPGLTARLLAEMSGVESHVLTINQMPSHNHTGITGEDSPDHSHTFPMVNAIGQEANYNFASVGSSNNTGFSTTNAGTYGATARHRHGVTAEGGGQAHPNMPPYIGVNVFIKF